MKIIRNVEILAKLVRCGRAFVYVGIVRDGRRVLHRTIPAAGSGLALDRAERWAVAHGATDGQPVPDDQMVAFLEAITPLLAEAHAVTVKAVDPETAFGDAVLTPEEMGALCAVLAEAT